MREGAQRSPYAEMVARMMPLLSLPPFPFLCKVRKQNEVHAVIEDWFLSPVGQRQRLGLLAWYQRR